MTGVQTCALPISFALFLDAVRSVDKTALGEQARLEIDRPILNSSHELSQEQKQAFEASLLKLMGASRPVSYEINPELGLGFELRFENLTVHKSIRKYLEETETTIRGSLEKSGR